MSTITLDENLIKRLLDELEEAEYTEPNVLYDLTAALIEEEKYKLAQQAGSLAYRACLESICDGPKTAFEIMVKLQQWAETVPGLSWYYEDCPFSEEAFAAARSV